MINILNLSTVKNLDIDQILYRNIVNKTTGISICKEKMNLFFPEIVLAKELCGNERELDLFQVLRNEIINTCRAYN